MDTMIFLALTALIWVAMRGKKRGVVAGVWFVALFTALLLFNHHVTDPLGYSW